MDTTVVDLQAPESPTLSNAPTQSHQLTLMPSPEPPADPNAVPKPPTDPNAVPEPPTDTNAAPETPTDPNAIPEPAAYSSPPPTPEELYGSDDPIKEVRVPTESNSLKLIMK